ncbi:AgmX/PglI C-terminal domain-containing protein [Nannocystaceae bacterium ST9]
MSRSLALASLLLAFGCAHAGASEGAAERQAVIEANMPELQACWASVADQYPGKSGTVMFSVDLRRKGSVDWVDVDLDEIGAPKLITCAVRRIKKWRFPEGRKQTIGFGVGFTSP